METAVGATLLCDSNIWTKIPSAIFAGISLAAGVSNGIAGSQQFDYAGKIGQEIDERKATQELNASTMEMHAEEIDCYDGFMQGVEDLELEIPDDVAPVEESEIPTAKPTGQDALPENLKPKKEENQKAA